MCFIYILATAGTSRSTPNGMNKICYINLHNYLVNSFTWLGHSIWLSILQLATIFVPAFTSRWWLKRFSRCPVPQCFKRSTQWEVIILYIFFILPVEWNPYEQLITNLVKHFASLLESDYSGLYGEAGRNPHILLLNSHKLFAFQYPILFAVLKATWVHVRG